MGKDKELDYKQYEKLFRSLALEGLWVSTDDGTESIFIDQYEDWRQCYSPYSTARAELPKYWFVNSKGDLISVQSGKAVLLKKDDKLSAEDREQNPEKKTNRYLNYHYDGGANITAHTLVALVFESMAYGRAQELINEKGLAAFGNSAKEDNVQTHHLDSNKQNNRPSNLENVTALSHKILNVNQDRVTDESRADFMQRFCRAAAVEDPGRISLLIMDEQPDIRETTKQVPTKQLRAVNDISFSQESFQKALRLYNKAVQEKHRLIADECIKLILQHKSIDYFNDKRFICYKNQLYFECLRTAVDEISTTEVEYSEEIKNPIFIGEMGAAV